MFIVWWDRELKKQLSDYNFSFKLYAHYADDGSIAIKKITNDAGTDTNTFLPWKTELFRAVKGIINKIKAKPLYTVLEHHRNVLSLTKLRGHFVLVLVDKASKNVCFICKQYYMQTLLDEIINNVSFALVNNEEGEITRELKSLYTKL